MIGLHPCSPMGSCAVLRPLLQQQQGSAQPLGCPQQQLAKPTPFEISRPSTVYPITKAAIKEYQATRSGKAVGFELKEIGPSAGFRQFRRGNIPLTNAYRPI